MVTTLTLQAESSEGKRLSDSVYETMLNAIISGKLKPGTIVSEVALARQLNVSRTPVHDALRQLAKDGLVQQRANHRAVIAEFTAADIYDTRCASCSRAKPPGWQQRGWTAPR